MEDKMLNDNILDDMNALLKEAFVGKRIVFVKMNEGEDKIGFTLDDGNSYIMHHVQDCCESVYVESTSIPLESLIGEEILEFEERTMRTTTDYADSTTSTLYDVSTLTKHCQIRWVGSSNGYYSEEVSFTKLIKTDVNEALNNDWSYYDEDED